MSRRLKTTMSKLLHVDTMLEVAEDAQLTGLADYVAALEMTASNLATALAQHFEIDTRGAAWMGKESGGLLASFYQKTPDQPCPPGIDQGDWHGEWEMQPVTCEPVPRGNAVPFDWTEQWMTSREDKWCHFDPENNMHGPFATKEKARAGMLGAKPLYRHLYYDKEEGHRWSMTATTIWL